MKSFAILAAAFVATTAASAADLPRRGKQVPAAIMAPAPVASWTGFYAGVHAGYASTSNQTPSANGAFGGLQVGYDQQFGALVAGVGADFSLANVRGSATNFSFRETGLGSVNARLGYAVSPQFLLYGKLGLAMSNVKMDDWATPASSSGLRTGLMLGLGAEVKLTNNISAFAEYRATQISIPTVGTFNGGTQKQNSGLVGVNYRF